MSRTCPLLLALVVGAAGAPALARAAPVCTFSSGPTTLNFGAYNPAAASPTDSTATFQFVCNPGNPKVTVFLSTGAGTFSQRQMALGADRLGYNLYQDAARTIIWGDGTPPSQADPNDRENHFYTIYGRIPAGQWVAAGTYSDTITVTLNY